jgi:hypothetical protein
MTAAGGSPTAASVAATREDRSTPGISVVPSWPPAPRAARQPASAAQASTLAATATPPPASTGRSTARPGCSSARRATPSGVVGDSATAPATASTAPPSATGAARITATPTSWLRVMPSARRVGDSAVSSRIWRPRVWPTSSKAASATSSANPASAPDSNRIARRVPAVLVSSLASPSVIAMARSPYRRRRSACKRGRSAPPWRSVTIRLIP